MSTTEVIDGLVRPDGTLELAHKATLAPGRVRVTMERMPASAAVAPRESFRNDVESFVQSANRLDRAGHRNAAMDLIYDRIDEMMRRDQMPALDALQQSVPVEELTVDVLLALLTATLPVKKRLKARPDLFERTERVLRDRGEYEDGLLTGLE
jgi:hypothetical protein